MTGSGMGCPDWPKCFGQYIPPTCSCELPDDYKEAYLEKRKKKVLSFAKMLDGIGMESQAEKLRNDKSVLVAEEFNVANTWTEYVNRLIGVLAGIFIFVQGVWTLFSRKFWVCGKRLIALSIGLGFVTVFQAWMGAMVVATNITPWVLTTHMLLALLMIAMQLQIIKDAKPETPKLLDKGTQLLLLGALILTCIEVIFGTQVRQQVDIALHHADRNQVMDKLPEIFEIHRTFAIGIVLLNVAIFMRLKRRKNSSKASRVVLIIIASEALLGIGMSYLGIPAFMQPMHLVLACLLFAVQFGMLIQLNIAKLEYNSSSLGEK